jgi:hypothetical protein
LRQASGWNVGVEGAGSRGARSVCLGIRCVPPRVRGGPSCQMTIVGDGEREPRERERERERPWQAAMHGARWKKQGWLKRRGEASRLSERG